MKRPPGIIAIEGVDGSGKSSLCESFRHRFACDEVIVVKTPCGPLAGLAATAKKQGLEGSLCAYMMANTSLIKLYPDHTWIIADRYTLSTQVFHSEIASPTQLGELMRLTGCPVPLVTVYLEAPAAVVEKRLLGRRNLSNHSLATTVLHQRFERSLQDPWISSICGKVIRLPSVNEQDQLAACELLGKLVSGTRPG